MANKNALERALWQQGYSHVAGVDEAGRGALAGPVVAAAVILPAHLMLNEVDDSKKLRAAARDRLFQVIHARALAVAVSMQSPAQIDASNILRASLQAMRDATMVLSVSPDMVLIDGIHAFDAGPWPMQTVKHGDARCQSIAAASIIAKVTRDRIMHGLHSKNPHYGWSSNVGYPTQAHYAGLQAHGPTPHHRRSFRLAPR